MSNESNDVRLTVNGCSNMSDGLHDVRELILALGHSADHDVGSSYMQACKLQLTEAKNFDIIHFPSPLKQSTRLSI